MFLYYLGILCQWYRDEKCHYVILCHYTLEEYNNSIIFIINPYLLFLRYIHLSLSCREREFWLFQRASAPMPLPIGLFLRFIQGELQIREHRWQLPEFVLSFLSRPYIPMGGIKCFAFLVGPGYWNILAGNLDVTRPPWTDPSLNVIQISSQVGLQVLTSKLS